MGTYEIHRNSTTSTLAEMGARPVSRTRIMKSSLGHVTAQAMRVAAYHDKPAYIVPTAYGLSITWDRGQISPNVSYREVECTFLSNVYHATIIDYHWTAGETK
mgnify:CR=1 FL=1